MFVGVMNMESSTSEIGRYQGVELHIKEIDALYDLEALLSEPIFIIK